MGRAGKGPGIGWSRVQPKYSWEANLYATRWLCADRSRTEQQWKIITSRTMLIFSRVCAVQKLKIHLFAYYSNATKLYVIRYKICQILQSWDKLLSRVVLQKFIVTVELLYNQAESDFVHVKQKCGPLPPGSAVNLTNWTVIETELFIKMLYGDYGVWSSLQPDHETNKSPHRMQVSPPARNDDRSPIWNIWRPLIYLFSSEDKYKGFSLYQREDWPIDWNQLQLCEF